MTDLSESEETNQPVGLEDRNAPIIDIIGSQAAAPVLPSGATFVGAGQIAQANEFQQTPQITDIGQVAVPDIAQAPATQLTPTTAPTVQTAQRAEQLAPMQAATLAAPTRVIDAPQRGVSEQAIPIAATQDLQEQATVQYQLSELYKTIEEGKPLPAWASGAARGASQVMQQRGLGSSSMAVAARTQALLEAGVKIAATDAASVVKLERCVLGSNISGGYGVVAHNNAGSLSVRHTRVASDAGMLINVATAIEHCTFTGANAYASAIAAGGIIFAGVIGIIYIPKIIKRKSKS